MANVIIFILGSIISSVPIPSPPCTYAPGLCGQGDGNCPTLFIHAGDVTGPFSESLLLPSSRRREERKRILEL